MKLKHVFTKRALEEGERVPRGYGFAYSEVAWQRSVFYPIPLNLLVNLHRKLQERITWPSNPALERMLRIAYSKGIQDGTRIQQERLNREFEMYTRERPEARR